MGDIKEPFAWPESVNSPLSAKTVWDKNRFVQPETWDDLLAKGIPTFSLNKATPAMGWECPRCHRIHAPHIDQCIYCFPESTNNTDAENDLE